MRYFIYITYLGKFYSGWQIQKNSLTIQQVIEEALNKVLVIPITISGSSRTDKGVHAIQQVAHFDIKKQINISDLIYRLNRILPSDISITTIRPVLNKAHARFDAFYRKYHYTIITNKNPFYKDHAVWISHIPPLTLLNKIATLFCIKTDFEFFSKVSKNTINKSFLKSISNMQFPKIKSITEKYSSIFDEHIQSSKIKLSLDINSRNIYNNFICNVEEAIWFKMHQKIIFQIKANRFLRGMVRIIVGIILKVAMGKMDLEQLLSIIREKPTIRPILTLMPPHGLTLMEIGYPETLFI